VSVDPLITHRIPFAEAESAYDLLTGKTPGSYLGIVLTYPEVVPADGRLATRVELGTGGAAPAAGGAGTAIFAPTAPRATGQPVGVGFLGAGNFATSMLLPHLRGRKDVRLTGVATQSGLSARSAAEKFGFAFCASDADELLADPATEAVFVVTRHHLHGALAARALAAGRAVFVEKPLATTPDDLARVTRAMRDAAATGRPGRLMVGFNRRFAPLVAPLAAHFEMGRAPLLVSCRVNAGWLGSDSWYQDPQQGGGRIVGEVCHFLDLVAFLTGAPIARVHASGLRDPSGHWRADDNLVVNVECANGSAGVVVYAAAGDPSMPKERIEVLGQSRSAALDNYRTLTLWSGNRRRVVRAMAVDKGHAAEVAAWIESVVQDRPSPISWASLENVALATFATMESLAAGQPVEVAST
jgi:predicted dehydrogenase